MLTSDIIIPANSSMFQAIKIASDFVGEAMAVVDQESGVLLGIVTEADIFLVYLEGSVGRSQARARLRNGLGTLQAKISI